MENKEENYFERSIPEVIDVTPPPPREKTPSPVDTLPPPSKNTNGDK